MVPRSTMISLYPLYQFSPSHLPVKMPLPLSSPGHLTLTIPITSPYPLPQFAPQQRLKFEIVRV